MNYEQLNEKLDLILNEDDEKRFSDMERSIDLIFSDISGWAFPFVDLVLLRMYDESEGLVEVTDEELLKYLKDQGFGIFEVTEKEVKDAAENAEVKLEDNLGEVFVSPQLDDLELKDQVIKAIEKGEF